MRQHSYETFYQPLNVQHQNTNLEIRKVRGSQEQTNHIISASLDNLKPK